MAGFHHEGPFYPAMVANRWIEEEPVEVREQDPEEDPEEYQEMEDGEEDSDEGSNEEEGIRAIVNEPYPIKSRHKSLPPPSFQVYRHPNRGPPWMNIPRKRILPIQRQTSLLSSASVQDVAP